MWSLPLPWRTRNCHCLSVCLFACLLTTLCKNFPTDLHEIFREGWQWAKEQVTKFWWRSRIRIRIETLVRRALAEVCTVPLLLALPVIAVNVDCSRYVKVPLISEYDAVSTSSSQKSSDGSLNVRGESLMRSLRADSDAVSGTFDGQEHLRPVFVVHGAGTYPYNFENSELEVGRLVGNSWKCRGNHPPSAGGATVWLHRGWAATAFELIRSSLPIFMLLLLFTAMNTVWLPGLKVSG